MDLPGSPGPGYRIMKTAVFLDRDGVLNNSEVRNGRAYAPLTLDQFRIFEEAPFQVDRLRSAGFLCIVFTNQPDAGRGVLPLATLEEMNECLRSQIKLDDLFVCIHDNHDGCNCRKPKPGMLLQASKKWGIDLKNSYVIGDRGCDIEAGQAVGCYSILIDRSYSDCSTADAKALNLTEAIDIVLIKSGCLK